MMADDGSQLTGEGTAFAPHRRLDLANEHDFQLGAFRVRPAYREVRRGDVIDILEPRVMQVLAALARRLGAVVSRDELLRDCWGDVTVTDDSLHRCIGRLRKLSESDDRQSFIIETVPRVGYRLVAADMAEAPEAVAVPPAQAAPARRIGHAPLIALALAVVALVAAGAWWLAGRPEAWRVAGYESVADTQSQEANPALSPSGGQLAYSLGGQDGPQDILVRNIHDGSTGVLVGGPARDSAPVWSPTADRVAFVRMTPDKPCEIMIKTLPDGPERRLAACQAVESSRLAWAPDGGRIYFIDRPSPSAARRIYSAATEGGPAVAVTKPSPWIRGDRDLAISPDGKRLAFIRMTGIGVSDLYVQDIAGGEPRRLTEDGVEIAGLAWSSTGRSLFFSSNRSGDFGVWSVGADGGEPVRLGPGLREVRRLSSGADGTLAMELIDLRANLAELGGKAITDDAGVQWAGDISPTGVLAFIADSRAGRAVWTRAPGQPPQKQTFFQATHMDDVRWSPDGRSLAFVAASHGRYGIYEVAAAGGPPRLLLSADHEISSLSWEADGKGLVFAANRGGARRLWRMSTATPGKMTPITGPGWVAVRVTPAGLLGMKQDTPGIWKLNGDGTRAQRLTDSPTVPSNAWIVRGDRQFWIDWPVGGAPTVKSASVNGGPVGVVAPAPDAPRFSGLAMDPASGAMVYTRQIRMGVDLGLMRLQRGS